MSQAQPPALAARRSGLLGIVIGLHVAGFALMILATRNVPPQLREMPMLVDFLQESPATREKSASPLPAKTSSASPRKAAPLPSRHTPVSEAAPASDAAVSAATEAPADTRPLPAAEPALTPARFDADYLKNPPPPYPPLSRRTGEQGKVVLRVSVSAQGSAEQIDIKTSSGSQRLDDAAVNTVRQWKFIPARQDDAPVPSRVLVPIIFKLEQ